MKDETKPGHQRDKDLQDKGANTNTYIPSKKQKDDEVKGDCEVKKSDKSTRR